MPTVVEPEAHADGGGVDAIACKVRGAVGTNWRWKTWPQLCGDQGLTDAQLVNVKRRRRPIDLYSRRKSCKCSPPCPSTCTTENSENVCGKASIRAVTTPRFSTKRLLSDMHSRVLHCCKLLNQEVLQTFRRKRSKRSVKP